MAQLEKTFEEILLTNFQGTKISQVWEQLSELRKKFSSNLEGGKCDVDKCMIQYFGKYHSFLKQSIRLKPIPFRYKIWCANLPFGYLFDFDVYEGSADSKIGFVEGFGLGSWHLI